jgi:hypothetical protein
VHILQRGVLDVDIYRITCIQLRPCRLDPAGQLCNFALGFGNLRLGFANLRIKISHLDLRLCV